MSVQVLLATVAGVLFLLTCFLGVFYCIDSLRFKNDSKKCEKELKKFVGMEGFFDTRSKTFFQSSPKNPIVEFEKCQFPDFEGYVPHIIPCKIAAIYPASRYTPEFIAFVDLDISVPIPIYVNILYVGKELVVFGSQNTHEKAKPKSFFANKHLKKGDMVSLDLIITRYTIKSFICDV